MELLFSQHHASGCSQAGVRPGAVALQVRPPCAVLAQALRDQDGRAGACRVRADV